MKISVYPKFVLVLFVVEAFCTLSMAGQASPTPTPSGTISISALNAEDDKAQALINKGQLEDALKLLNPLIQSNPTFAPGYASRAAVYAITEKYDLALADANRSLALDPKNIEGYTVRGGIKGRKNDFSGCIEDETQALMINFRYARSRYLRSLCYEALQKYEEMLGDSAEVIEIAPTYAGGYVEHGAASFSLGKYEQAIDDLQKAVDLDPADTKAHDYFVEAVNGNRKFTATLVQGREDLAKSAFESFAARLASYQKETTEDAPKKCASLSEVIGYFKVAQLARRRTRFSDMIDDTKSGNAELIRLDEQHLKNHKEAYDIVSQLDAALKQEAVDQKCTVR